MNWGQMVGAYVFRDGEASGGKRGLDGAGDEQARVVRKRPQRPEELRRGPVMVKV